MAVVFLVETKRIELSTLRMRTVRSPDVYKRQLMDKAHAYVENWKEAYKSNIGLLLFGDVGTGKSFFAGCIANALLDRDVPVLMTNFPTILNRLTGMFSGDRSEFIASFDEYDLLIMKPERKKSGKSKGKKAVQPTLFSLPKSGKEEAAKKESGKVKAKST